MLEMFVALIAAPAVQTAPTEAPRTAQAGDLTVSNGGMMAWMSRGQLGGQVMVRVENAGSEPDRILSIRTPAGTTGKIGVYPIVNGRGTRAPDGEVSIQPGGTGVTAELTDIVSGRPQPLLTTVTIVFERAGEITVQAVPTSPAPPPPPR